MDEGGQVWWTGAYKDYLGRLDTGAATIATFAPFTSGAPQMLTLSGSEVCTRSKIQAG